ncbi:MAG: MFS transporter [Gaiellales bacterium]
MDLLGLALISVLLVALLVTLRSFDDGQPAWAVAAVGLALLGAFIAVELRAPRPAVDPRLFLVRPFAAAITTTLLATVILHGTLIIVPLLVERVMAGGPAASGLVLLGISGLGALAAPFAGRISDRAGRRAPALAGMALAAAGLAVLWFVAGAASTLVVGILLSIVGLGLGLAGSPAQAAALETVEFDRVGMAASTFYTGRYLGGVLGASLAGAVLGVTVTASGASLGFGLLALAGLAAAGAALGLPSRLLADRATIEVEAVSP